MATDILERSLQRPLPRVSFGPFKLLEAVPWLMFAAAMRYVAYGKPALVLPALILASVSSLLAFLLAARRMIEFADGQTALGRLDFGEQLRVARSILSRVAVLLIAGAVAVALLGFTDVAPAMLLGFDGIAFDQIFKPGIMWSGVLAAFVLLMAVQAGDGGKVSLVDALKELWHRRRHLFAGIAVVVVLQIVLSTIQGLTREELHAFLVTWDVPAQVRNITKFSFVFAFATFRLWMTLAVLVFALRESYRRAGT
jgi:hypothetical protein